MKIKIKLNYWATMLLTGCGIAGGDLGVGVPPAIPPIAPPAMSAEALTKSPTTGIAPAYDDFHFPKIYACNLLDKNTFDPAIYAGFAPPYLVFDEDRPNFMRGTCVESEDGTPERIDAPVGLSGNYFYKKGCEWTGGTSNNSATCGYNSGWKEITFSSTLPSPYPDWIEYADGDLPYASAHPGQTNYYVAYLCHLAGRTWQCGCSTPGCATHEWSLQTTHF